MKARGLPLAFLIYCMKAEVLQRSLILRYEGEYTNLSALRLSSNLRVADHEAGDVRGHGEVAFLGENDLSLSYREEESGMTVSLKKEGERMEIHRGGAVHTFCLGGMTSFVYRTAYGSLPTEAITEELSLQRKGKSALLTLVYTAVLAGMAQKNELRFKITY